LVLLKRLKVQQKQDLTDLEPINKNAAAIEAFLLVTQKIAQDIKLDTMA
jgi:hypothetical protein